MKIILYNVLAFIINNCTFALPKPICRMGMECLIKINYCEQFKLQDSIS